MGKRFWSLVLSMALIGGVFAALPARAQEAPAVTVPAVVQIEDPLGDANSLGGDQVLPADTGSQTDIEKVWFSTDATNLNVNFLTQGPPTAQSFGFLFEVAAGPEGCLVFEGFSKGTSYVSDNLGRVTDGCNSIERAVTTFTFGAGPDGKGLATITAPLSYSPLFAPGGVIKAPVAETRLFVGGEPLVATGYRGVGQLVDDTKAGTDYTVAGDPVAGGPGKPAKPKAPGKNDPPGKGKKKGCDKGKGQKKGACPGKKPAKPKPAAGCAPYVPGEEGKEAQTTIVTDAATAEKPVEVALTADVGLGSMPISGTPVPYNETTSIFQNLQVDSSNPEAGLYVRFEFPEFHDYDLYLNRPDGTTAANSGDFQAAPGHDLGGGSPEGGWEAGTDYEQVMGLRTADCSGYTARMVSYLTNGGDVTLKAWLGEILVDPAPAEGAATAADMFFGMLEMDNPMARSADSSDSAQASSTPAANKGCKKGKGKKKGCKKPPVSCSPYTPGELGAEQPTVTVTDSHTADAPLAQAISLDPAVDEGVLEAVGAGETPRAVFNVQVDSALQSAGLYVTFEFDTHRDYDLYGYFPDGKVAASSHGFQPAMETNDLPDDADQSNTDSNHGGESTATSENLVGIITPDCGGYTLEFSSYLAEGGDFEVKLWLGEGVTEPGAPE